MDLEGTFSVADPAAAKMLGYTAEKIYTSRFTTVMPMAHNIPRRIAPFSLD
jgi:PAS domain-containing protein